MKTQAGEEFKKGGVFHHGWLGGVFLKHAKEWGMMDLNHHMPVSPI